VGKIKLAIADNQRSACGPHAVKFRVLGGVSLNPFVSPGKSLEQSGVRITADDMVVNVAHCLDRQSTRFLAAFVSAHPIGDHRESAFAVKFIVGDGFPIKIGILIVLALAAYIAQAGNF
jgi:hypothetical protein